MKKMILIISMVGGLFGCVSKSIDLARTPSNSGDSDCLSRFQLGSTKMAGLLNKYPEVYGDLSSRESRQIMASIPIRCVPDFVDVTGVQASRNEIIIEQSFKSVSHFFESAVGQATMRRYNVNPRSSYFERMMVAYSAHAYSKALGNSEDRYDTFFKTLAILQKDLDK